MKIKIYKPHSFSLGQSSAIMVFDRHYIPGLIKIVESEKPIKYIEVSNDRPRSTGPLSQNAKYYACRDDIASFFEIPKSMAHDGLKQLGVDERIIPEVYNPISKKREGKSEGDWTSDESAGMIELALRFMAENGIRQLG
jgi:hypothetical protein